jgi:type IV pilus biogenesis protein CpaD/CtpE
MDALMQTYLVRTLAKAVLLSAALACLQACSPVYPPPNNNAVAQAFETSDVIAIKPYTRSIFNTTNF